KGHEAAGFTVLLAGDASVLAFLALAAALESLFLTVFLAAFFAVDDFELVALASVVFSDGFTVEDADDLLAGAAAVSLAVDLLALLAVLLAAVVAVLVVAFLAALVALVVALLAAVLVAVFLAAVFLAALDSLPAVLAL